MVSTVFLKALLLYQSIFLCLAFDLYCPPPTANATGAVKTFVKYKFVEASYLPEGWFPTEVRYACNEGLGPHKESVCKFTGTTSNEKDWIPPIDQLLSLNCSATNYTANGNDTVETLCTRHGGHYIESKRRCLIIPHLHIQGNERYETCDRLAAVFGNANLKGRPWIVADNEAYDILVNVIFGPKRAMKNSSAAYGPSSNYRESSLQILDHGYWLNGNRLYPDADTCDTAGYCTDDVIEAKGPGDHKEILDGSLAPNTLVLFDLWTSADGINTNMCLLARAYESAAANPYFKIVWTETVFCDEMKISSSHFPFTLPVICELLIWPPTCDRPSMSADVVLLNGSSPVLTEMEVDVPISVKCALPAAYVVADDKAYTQLDIVCNQTNLELPRLSHKKITCAQVGCGNVTVLHATVDGSQTKPELGFVVGEVATVACNEGYDTEVKNANGVMCIQDNSTADNGNFTLKWNMSIPQCIETSRCNQKDLKLPCGADRFIFTHANGTETKDIQQSTYPHGTKVQIECHRNCPGAILLEKVYCKKSCNIKCHLGQSDLVSATGIRECRFGKWHNCFHKCMCNCSSAIIIKCQQSAFRRGWSASLSAATEWRRYANPSKCCYICSLYNRHKGATDGEGKCLAFNLRKVQYGVECQFFNQTDTNPVFDRQFYYFNLVV